MRRHGFELPYHPLQVVAIAVFVALAFAFYVFFVPFVGKKIVEYIIVGIFSFLLTSVFSLYIWCAITDPADPAVLRSKNYGRKSEFGGASSVKDSLPGPGSVDGINMDSMGEKTNMDESSVTVPIEESINQDKKESGVRISLSPCLSVCLWLPLALTVKKFCASKATSEPHTCEDDMLYCSLCKVEIYKNSKHCRVCDKCVDSFDHHCRWINNCIGRRNYREFFVLMISALLLLILQWSIGLFVIVRCFLNRSHFDVEIVSKLGSSFSLGPFVVVLGSCTILSMVATLPLVQLFFFHVLLIRKGVSTYDYIVAMREQEQQNMGGAQSPQMSLTSSASVLSHSSSMNALHHGSWCTPPRLFVEDQFSVLPRDSAMPSIKVDNRNIKRTPSEQTVQKNKGSVKISPWALARMNAEEVSRVAAQARKNSKVLRPISRQKGMPVIETDSSLEGSSRDLSTEIYSNSDSHRRMNKRGRSQSLGKNFPFTRSLKLTKVSLETASKSNSNRGRDLMDINQPIRETSVGLAPLQLEAQSAFRSSLAMSTGRLIASSAGSSFASPDLQPFRESTSGIVDIPSVSAAPSSITEGPKLQRSTSDGYEASGGESADDSDRASAKLRKLPWNKMLLNPAYMGKTRTAKPFGYKTSQMPHDMNNFRTSGQERGLTMQSNSGKSVLNEIPEGTYHPIEGINTLPVQYDSPERDLDFLGMKRPGLEDFSKKKPTTRDNVVPLALRSAILKRNFDSNIEN
ncbi:hypothetical protein SUGI_0252770 [Cryptomeria japonica]|uniref:probable protein S-acyltransferase 22 n=1 Tax=Cryptomeria japonica TaxID=3369 RepID=UPI0024089FDE|nr:probable protein S-acyltransferase 22 [Cryptomeria japonica]GLJ15399.1 hypothetical protein SUGI_0252770 [Cryptomeria japonica]